MFSLFKCSPIQIKIVVIYNIVSILFVLVVHLFTLSLNKSALMFLFLMSILLLVLNYFLLKMNGLAFYLMLMWFGIQTLTFNFPHFQFEFIYGPLFDIHIMGSSIGFNPLTITMFLILFTSRRKITNKTSSLLDD